MTRGKYVRTPEIRRKISESLKITLNKPETRGKYVRTPEIRRKASESLKIALNKPETKKKMSESRKKRIISEETKKKISESNKISQNKPEVKAKISEKMKGKNNPMYGKFGKEHPMYGKHHSKEAKEKIGNANLGKHLSEETKKKLSEINKGENHPNWNPNRTEVYAPYGENFYDDELRNEKWDLQKGRDMLTGTKLDPNKKPAYHHIDYCKSNDNPDNHCFLSINNHSRITSNQSNPIKSERYKRILQENTQSLKNGQIPKNWSQINKELFRQEKLKQLDLSSYII